MSTCELAHLDAAYVLGALAPEERLAFERHLATCPSCSAAVRDLAGLPGLLAQVSPEVVESPREPEPVPDTLLPSLVREVRRSQHRRRWGVGLAAAAAVVALGAGTVAVVAATGDDGPTPQATPTVAAAREMTQLDQTAVWGEVSLTSVLWGTRLDLTCSYDEPASAYLEGEHTYALVVHTRDGGTEQVATWKGLPGRTMRVTGATALTTDQIASVEVRDAAGHPLLELRS
ncbi:zf-HC2 domain-containing protein [Nocardioides aquiterrae]|uniref:Zf-HC2 domain-containing protein n=1 Tax=Nocardioides aquiterrae TaxID=203799 RepID=A0ABN1U8M1_9ACTN